MSQASDIHEFPGAGAAGCPGAETRGDLEALRREVAGIRWWHRIDLGHGIVTPGENDSPRTLRGLGLPEDLSGKTVLDVGAWDGFYSFEAERRGASRVLATDSYCWSGAGWGSKAGFELARRALRSRVEDRDLDVMELSPETAGSFDLVLFLGVLYHMRHPLLALERVHSVTRELLILETHVEELPTRKPAMVFYPGNELNHDPTNWWGPNAAAVEAMLRAVGFRQVKACPPPARAEPPLKRLLPHGAREWYRRLRRPQRRAVFHAWR